MIEGKLIYVCVKEMRGKNEEIFVKNTINYYYYYFITRYSVHSTPLDQLLQRDKIHRIKMEGLYKAETKSRIMDRLNTKVDSKRVRVESLNQKLYEVLDD